VKRTQTYLDEELDQRLAARAAETGRTKSDLIREAIDRYMRDPDDQAARLARFRAASNANAGKLPRLPSGVEYAAEIRRTDLQRLEALEQRWRG
jgi:predicted DNA-binding protein